ncbi:MAG TPA: hypothetical protein VN734_13010 [Acidobacteriaceae bacterium]|nr:hypothetical protein [Acidobacteriaceae bacterium]
MKSRRNWQRLPDRQAWLRSRWVDLAAAGDWILWQFDHPEISHATDVLHTTGESSDNGGYTVYADVVCRNALLGLAEMADSIGDGERAARWRNRAERMKQAIGSQYIVSDAKYGRVWTLESAGWPHKSTVLGPLIFPADSNGFAPQDDSPDWRAVNEATYQRLVDSYQPFGFYGQAMGYGQGFVTQAALLLDRMRDATEMLQWMAKQIHDPRFGSFIVPEGCEIDSTGRFWYRIGDLGNGVQEAEIIKALRIVIGVDDVHPNRLQFFPRMPFGWNEIAVNTYPIVFEHAGKTHTAQLHFKLRRLGENMELEIASDKQLGPVTARLGPFPNRPHRSFIRVNGIHNEASAEHSGDSWWMRLTIAVGPDQY